MFFVFAGLLALAAAGLMALPLLRAPTAPEPAARFNARVYRDQLAELERDLARGALSPEDAGAARLEIERRLLAAVKAEEGAAVAARRPAPLAGAALVAAVAAAALGIYAVLGSPPKAPPAPTDPQELQFIALLDQVKARLDKEPDSAEGWAVYADGLARLQRFREAVRAYERALALAPANMDLLGNYAEARVFAQLGSVDPQAEAAFSEVLRQRPGDPRAIYYLALAKAEKGNAGDALADLQALRDAIPPGSPLRAMVEAEIARVSAAAGQ